MTDPTARRKVMAEAIRRKYEELLSRPNWDAITGYHEMATAADEARDKFDEENKK